MTMRKNNNGDSKMTAEKQSDGTVMYVGEDWLQDKGGDTVHVENITQPFSNWRPYYERRYPWIYQPTTKIRLKLSEVEYLRKLCEDDKKLRETMEKFAPHIEVEVDFPGGEGH